ncbi:MAG: hypothetical protein K2U26_15380 [Cyclobacteriaceae bacterium]|nr:hypothetical protein [Cyclobacteriaceae bacterium]
MSQLVLTVKNKKKLPFLKELLKQMDFVDVVDVNDLKLAKKKAVLSDLEEAVQFVNQYKKGRAKAKSFGQLLHEL